MSQLLQTIPQTNPKAGYFAHKTEIDKAIEDVLTSGWYVLGEHVIDFETQFAGYIGVDHAIGVASGTDALHLALRACDIGRGDGVITVSHTAVATVAAIEQAGATPLLVDIDPQNYTIDLNQVEYIFCTLPESERPKAIIPVHLYGNPVDMPSLMEIAQKYGAMVIEDCSQAHGATISEKRVGAWGHIAAFSLYPTKNLAALGDGGIVTTDDYKLAEKVKSLRQYGWEERYVSKFPGYNSRLDELQAAILQVRLRYLDSENEQRRYLARSYQEHLSSTDLTLPYENNNVQSVYHQYVIRSKRRDALKQYLKDNNIGTLIHYPIPIHQQPAYAKRLHPIVSLKHTEYIAQSILSLPMFPQLDAVQVSQICEHILQFHQSPSGTS